MLFYYGSTLIGIALAFVLGRRTTVIESFPPSAETSAAWQRIRNG